MKLACIGIGSNAIRLLVASWCEDCLVVERRERIGTRLFAGLVNGMLTKQSIRSSVEAIAELAQMAHEAGAQEVFAFATSAVRDAANGDEFIALAKAACGANVEIVSGEREARLSYAGASDGGACGVVDIGGGSTEFTLGDGDRILGAVSLQLGAVRMHGQKPVMDEADYEQSVSASLCAIHRDAQALLAMPARERWVGVGGTMTTLGAMENGVQLFDPVTCEGMRVTQGEVSEWGHKLSAMPMEQRKQVVGLMPHRADIMPCGLAILEAAMRAFDMGGIRLSAHGNMDGYLKSRFRDRMKANGQRKTETGA